MSEVTGTRAKLEIHEQELMRIGGHVRDLQREVRAHTDRLLVCCGQTGDAGGLAVVREEVDRMTRDVDKHEDRLRHLELTSARIAGMAAIGAVLGGALVSWVLSLIH